MKKRTTKTNAACDCNIIHKDIVACTKKKMPEREMVFEVAEFFRIFGDSTRVGILAALMASEMCGCDLCAVLNMTQSAVSHQLRILKQARLVRSRRDGKIVYFRLDDEHIGEILRVGMAHCSEN
jgi:ArsR family transcriptional regulator, lead/cadmium/zinc/bismuth-responsive transcriptional repressor